MRRQMDNPQDYHGAYAAYKNLTTPELYVDNELCVKWNVNKDYWVSYNAVHPFVENKTSGSITTYTLGASFLIAVLLIELALLI